MFWLLYVQSAESCYRTETPILRLWVLSLPPFLAFWSLPPERGGVEPAGIEPNGPVK